MAAIRSRDWVTVNGTDYLLLSFKAETTNTTGYYPRLAIERARPHNDRDTDPVATIAHPDYRPPARYWTRLNIQAWADTYIPALEGSV